MTLEFDRFTVAESVTVSGLGLHSGAPVDVTAGAVKICLRSWRRQGWVMTVDRVNAGVAAPSTLRGDRVRPAHPVPVTRETP